jgi:hypothetical protein
MRGGLERLQKEMDALTYNSRTVLNALIRSTVVNGSSQGFTVTRVTETITLSRVDIYRLYRFYQEWEENEFSTVDVYGSLSQKALKGFYTIVDEHDSVTVVDDSGVSTSSATTDALVKHSQILFLNESNIDLLTMPLHWLGLIEDSNNPKLVSNSSPIPINLRTPVFDENLATTRYNQHPTYLFPNAYYILDAFGYSGDDTDHRMDGKSWTIGADESVSIESPKIAMGDIDTRDTRKTRENRNGPDTRSNYSTVWGYNTHARALYSTAGGRRSMVSIGAFAAIAVGNTNYSSNNNAAVIGGTVNTGAGEYIGIMSGSYNTVVADRGGILAGRSNLVGAAVHNFTFPVDNIADVDCIVSVDDCYDDMVSTGGSPLGRNTIAITGDYSSSYKINDIVRLFRFTTKYDGETGIEFYEVNGDIYDTQDVNVTSVEYIDPATNPDNLNVGMTVITLSGDVIGMGVVDGGRISVKQSANRIYDYGANSVALGLSSVAKGEDQTVVGHYNYIDVNSRFIVGTGTSSARGTGLNVTDAGVILSATPRNADMRLGIDGYYGIDVTQTGIQAAAGTSSVRLFASSSFLGYNYGYGTAYGYSVYGNTRDQNIIIQGSEKPVLIRSNPYVSINPNLVQHDIGIVSENRNKILSMNSGTFISKNDYIAITAGTNLNLTWAEQLLLSGDTFGALPTTSDQYAFRVNASNITNFTVDGSTNESTIAKTGFYYLDGDMSPMSNLTGLGNTGSDTSVMNTVMSARDDSGNIEGWELFSTTYSSDALDGFGRIYVSKFRVQNNVYGSRGAKPLAWWDDIKDWGIWYNLVPSTGTFGIATLTLGGGPSFNGSDNRTEIRSVVKHLSYTIIQNTVHLKLRIDYNSVEDLWGNYKYSNSQDIEIELNPSMFTRRFNGGAVTPGSVGVGISEIDDKFVAQSIPTRTIRIRPSCDISSYSMDIRTNFSITDELISQ